VWSGLLTSTMATLSHVLPERRRVDGLSLFGLASPMGVVFGPVLGLWIHHHLGFPAIALLLFLLFGLLSFLSRWMPNLGPSGVQHRVFQLPEAAVAGPCLILFVTALGYGALNSYSAQEALALGFPFPAAFLTSMALGMVAMRLAMARIGFGTRPIRLLPGMLALTTVGMGILLLPGSGLRHGLAGFLYGGGYSMMHTLLNAYVLDRVSPQRRGAAFGATLFAFDAGIGLGAFALGWLIGHHGYRWGWAAGTLLLLVSLTISMGLARGPTELAD
jgi:MFS family permease